MRESQQSVLLTSERFTLYSLWPIPLPNLQTGNGRFHGHMILGQTEVTDAPLKRRLVESLYRSIAENTGFEAACHNPRHAIRAVKGRRIIEMAICFECFNIMVFENGRHRMERTTTSPEPIFNSALRAAKIPIDKRQH